MTNLSCKRLALELGGALEKKSGWIALCPAHEDHNPSLSIKSMDGKLLFRCFAGCTQNAVIDALKRRNLWKSSKHTPTHHQSPRNGAIPDGAIPGCTLADYAEAKLLSTKFLRRECGLRETVYRGQPAVKIPYMDSDGEVIATRYRIGVKGNDKFRWLKGDKPCLYGLDRIAAMRRENNYVCVVEGEFDSQTLWSAGIPAIGVPGASNWDDQRDFPHLKEFKIIYFVFEPDAGGLRLREKLAASSLSARVRVVRLGNFKDANEYFQHDPDRFRKVERKLSKALPIESDVKASKNAEREVIREKCRDLSKCEDILAEFAADFRSLGAVGVTKHAKLIFLATVSRLFNRPISIAVKGPSSGGKSFLVELVLKFFPPAAYYALTAMSERAVAYTTEPLKHRMLVIYEAAGMSGDIASYLIRSLLSEGKIRYETVQRSPEGALEQRPFKRKARLASS